MAIALPPPPTPQQGELPALRAEASREPSIAIDYRGVRLCIFGSQLVTEERLREAVGQAASLSDAIRAIGASYYRAGYPATLLSYAADRGGQATVYVRVVPGKVSEVRGAEELRPWFRDLPQHAPLTDAQFEGDRDGADILSTRAGQRYEPAFVPAGRDSVVLDLGQPRPGPAQTTAAASFNNYGNRYAGPYLANLGLRHSFGSGDEFSLGGSTALRMLGLGGDHAGPYHGADAAWSRITRLGSFGVQGRYADFEETADNFRFKGRLHEIGLIWRYVPYTSFSQRLGLEGRLLHDREALGAPAQAATVSCDPLSTLLAQLGLANCQAVRGGADVFEEHYDSAELSLAYAWRSTQAQHQLEFNAGVLLRKGLDGGRTPGTGAGRSYFLWQPALSLRYALSPRFTLAAAGNAQFSGAVLPQQQQYLIGGPTTLHAYLVGAGVGDQGETANLGLEWNGEDGSLAQRLSLHPRLFVEYASSTHRGTALGEPAGTVRLGDAGLALDLSPLPGMVVSFSISRPILEQGGRFSPDQLQSRLMYFQLAAAF